MPAEAGSEGFTLVEVLVALLITAMLVAILSDGLGGIRRRDADARQRLAASLFAQSVIEDAASDAFRPGVRLIARDGLSARVSEEPLRLSNTGLIGLVEIRVGISDDRQRPLFALMTRRLMRLDPS